MLKENLREFAKESSRLSFPSSLGNEISLYCEQNTALTFTPPSDGWLFLDAKGVNIDVAIYQSQYRGTKGLSKSKSMGSTYYPCVKGIPVYYFFSGDSFTYTVASFYPCKSAL